MLDSNILLDLITADAVWLEWSTTQFREATAEGPVLLNPIIYAEIAPAFPSQSALDDRLKPSLFRRLPLPYEAGFRASRAFMSYRERGGAKTSPMPDFYIGAHAELEQFTLVTRDATRFGRYFPGVRLVTP